MKTNSIKVNFIMNIILTMSSFIFPLITFPYVSHILQPIGMGKVSFATSLISYFSMLAQLGIPTYGIRVCAQIRDDREQLTRAAHELICINLLTNLLSYLLLVLCVLFIPRLREDRNLYLLLSITIILTSVGMEWIYKALEQYKYIAIRSIIFKFIALILMFVFIHKQSDYVKYAIITIFAASASNILNLLNIHKFIDFRFVGNYNIKKHIKPIIVFFAMTCATTIYTNLDSVMLGFMKSDVDVGYYNAAVKIKYILVAIVTSLGTVLLPRVSYYIEKGNNNEFIRITKKALTFVITLATPLMMYFIIFAKESILFLAGNQYGGAIIPMKIIMPTVLLIGISNLLGIQILVPLGKEQVLLKAEIVGALVDIIINLLLIPKYGATGAAIGTLVAEGVVAYICYVALKTHIKNMFKEISYKRIFIALLFAVVSSCWIKYIRINYLGMLVFSSIIFGLVYGVMLFIMKDDIVVEIINIIKNQLKRL